MSSKPKTATSPADKPVMTINAEPNESRSETISRLTTDGVLPLSMAAHMFSLGLAGDELDLTAMHGRMTGTANDAARGDLAPLERMLSAQAQTLNAMFCELSRRAALNMGENLSATETYLRLALKAQAQSRATVEALGELKNPRSVAFVRQANIAQQQQVNNHAPHARPQEPTSSKNELLEAPNHEQGMDTRTTPAPARCDTELETVGTVNRAEIGRG